MPHLKKATLTFLSHLGFTGLAAGAFALVDYVSNHNTINWQILLIFITGPVLIAIFRALQTYYQSQGDQTTSDALAQVSAAIAALEQRFMQRLSLPERGSPLHDPHTPTVPLPSVSPIAPRFPLPDRLAPPLDRPTSVPVEQTPPPPKSNGAPPLFTLTGPDMDERLAQFPFPFRPQEK